MASIKDFVPEFIKKNRINKELIKFDCDICKDTGEVSCDEMDNEGNWQSGVGTQKCECRFDSEVDFSGASEGDR